MPGREDLADLSDPSQCCDHWLQKEMNMIVITVSLLMDKSVAFSVAT
jgi:hypothetical protein